MPTYDYRCKKCEHQFEAFQSMSAAALSECPVCGGPVERLIGGGAGLVFKGSGFYITDYKNDAKSPKSDNKPSGETKPTLETTAKKEKSD